MAEENIAVSESGDGRKSFEVVCGVLIALFAAVLAITVQRTFFWGMNLLGAVGALISIYAFYLGTHAP